MLIAVLLSMLFKLCVHITKTKKKPLKQCKKNPTSKRAIALMFSSHWMHTILSRVSWIPIILEEREAATDVIISKTNAKQCGINKPCAKVLTKTCEPSHSGIGTYNVTCLGGSRASFCTTLWANLTNSIIHCTNCCHFYVFIYLFPKGETLNREYNIVFLRMWKCGTNDFADVKLYNMTNPFVFPAILRNWANIT